ncbi:MAG: hypothetical protein HY304_09160 [candidate division Zixibacteria bacterium]|nr:hypothetical protein [candidate division Zixibacteria bacterium]
MYRFSIHDFSDLFSDYSFNLSNSGAQVKIYRGSSLVATYNVPTNREGTLWTVFEMQGDNITPVNRMSYQSQPDGITNTMLPNKNSMPQPK